MKNDSSYAGYSRPADGAFGGFTLIELLVVIAIIGVLVTLTFTAVQRARKSAAETKSFAVLKSVLQASTLYSADNNGQINTLRWVGDPLEGGAKWVGNTFWGRLQPYLFTGISTTVQTELSSQIRAEMTHLFGCQDLNTMTGTPFENSPRYGDGSGLPIPFAFNHNLYVWGSWVRQQQVYSLPSTIYATYGFGVFTEADAQTYQKMPTSKPVTNNIYYLPSQSAIMGFLDGRVEFRAPPIAERMITIVGTGQ